MKKQALLLLSILLGLLLVLSGCSAPVSDLMAGVKAAEWPQSPDEPDAAFINSVSQFSWKLFQESMKNPGNVLISPASVYIALAMTLNGADQDTRTAMLDALSAEGLSVDALNRACRDWTTLLENTNQTTRLSIANSIWMREGFPADKDFLQRNADYYAAAARALDFNKPDSVDTINQWVKQSTEGKIEKIIENIGPFDVMYLINAVYFNAEWLTQFEAAKTIAGTFSAPGGESQVKYMNRIGSIDYISGENCEGVLLPYKDGRFALVAILPEQGLAARDLISSFTADTLSALVKGRVPTSIELRLPKFETRYEAGLVDDLKKMGMAVAFNPDLADFSLMNSNREKNLFISDVRHKTFCRVDEKGTEAAAVTSITMGTASMPVSDRLVDFNRPFIYGIIDTTTGMPLFLGLMENPAE